MQDFNLIECSAWFVNQEVKEQERLREKISQTTSKLSGACSTADKLLADKTKQTKQSCHHKQNIIHLHLLIRTYLQ